MRWQTSTTRYNAVRWYEEAYGNYGWGTVHGNYRRDFYRLRRHFLLLRGIRPPARISPPLDIQGSGQAKVARLPFVQGGR